MELKIYGVEDKTEVVHLRLIEEHDVIKLVATDDSGEVLGSGYLARITKKGIDLCCGVDASLGFDLDKDECLKIVD